MRARHILRRMRKPDCQIHWEEIVRELIEQLGPNRLAETIDYVLFDADLPSGKRNKYTGRFRRRAAAADQPDRRVTALKTQ